MYLILPLPPRSEPTFICKLSNDMSVLCCACFLPMQPYDDPYIIRTFHHLLKWKFSHLNSVDFKLEAKPSKASLARVPTWLCLSPAAR
jgi:hypothetical protein